MCLGRSTCATKYPTVRQSSRIQPPPPCTKSAMAQTPLVHQRPRQSAPQSAVSQCVVQKECFVPSRLTPLPPPPARHFHHLAASLHPAALSGNRRASTPCHLRGLLLPNYASARQLFLPSRNFMELPSNLFV